MRVAHITATVALAAGGPAVSVRRLVECLSRSSERVECSVFSGDEANSRAAAAEWHGGSIHLFGRRGPPRLGWARGMRRALGHAPVDLIHLHGLWQFHALVAGGAARRRQLPLIVSPRGMLEPWALSRGRTQKFLANTLFQRRMLRDAACVVVTSQLEAKGVRAAGVTAPISVIPNGVDVPEQATPRGRANRQILFLSRIEAKKGVMELIEAWSRLRPVGWTLVVAGTDERGFARVVEAKASSLGLGDSVRFPGPLWGSAKARAFAEADVFVLPSYSENFGLAIGEALASGLPVITTNATPWETIKTERCGWWIDTGVDALVESLREAMALSPQILGEMGRRGRELVARNYSWTRVAEQMRSVYAWAISNPAVRAASPPFAYASL